MDPSNPSNFSSFFNTATGSSRQWAQGSVNGSGSLNRVKIKGGGRKEPVGRNPSAIVAAAAVAARTRIRRKPDPSAEKVTPPCSECGRRFWSLKALFGHMRCHPERRWRGINPPPPSGAAKPHRRKPFVDETTFSETELEVAGYLILLANGPPLATSDDHESTDVDDAIDHVDGSTLGEEQQEGRFECSGCKKVFGSHRALGGHRASHKNVKGCYAMNKRVMMINGVPLREAGDTTRVTGGNGTGGGGGAVEDFRNLEGSAPRCGICWRLFESYEALGVHRYSHGETAPEAHNSHSLLHGGYHNLDLNQAPMTEDAGRRRELDDEGLDLTLGI